MSDAAAEVAAHYTKKLSSLFPNHSTKAIQSALIDSNLDPDIAAARLLDGKKNQRQSRSSGWANVTRYPLTPFALRVVTGEKTPRPRYIPTERTRAQPPWAPSAPSASSADGVIPKSNLRHHRIPLERISQGSPPENEDESAFADFVTQELHRVYNWADLGVVRAIVDAQKGNFEAAEEILVQMVPSTVERRTSSDGGDKAISGATAPATMRSYSSLRKEALEATKHWESWMKLTYLAYRKGDQSELRRCKQEAGRWRLQVEELNEQAATRTLEQNNMNRGDYEIDLHGLHCDEALRALEERLVLIKKTKGTSDWTHSYPSGGPSQGRRGKKRPEGRLPTLRIVTGQGLHSAGGEAVLRRTVRNWLIERGFSFDEAAGFFDLTLSKY